MFESFRWRRRRSDSDDRTEPSPGDGRAVEFYRGERTDHLGRTLAELMTWDHEKLARDHGYVQWLFPIGEPSAFNVHAPVLGPEDIATFSQDPALRDALLRSLSLFVLGLPSHARAFLHERRELAREHPDAVTDETLRHWSDAAS